MNDEFCVYVITSQESEWLLPGFAYLFNKYWSRDQYVTIIGALSYEKKLPDNFAFQPVRKIGLYSDTLISSLDYLDLDCEYILIMNDSDWIKSFVDQHHIISLYRWLRKSSMSVLRCDLSGSQARERGTETWNGIGPYKERFSYSPHGSNRIRFYPSIWHRKRLIEILRPDENRLQIEYCSSTVAGHHRGHMIGVFETLIDSVNVLPYPADRVDTSAFKDKNLVRHMRRQRYVINPSPRSSPCQI